MMNYRESVSYVHSLLRFGIKPGMERIHALLEAVGNPQDALRVLHVAGTNGKGSVCTMMASALKTAGYKTGLFVSPYVVNFRERMQISGAYIGEEEFAEIATRLRPIAERNEAAGIGPTEFEFITAAAFLYFYENNCDYVVLETGLGGLLDSTNVVKKPLVSVITNIAFDHMAVLGSTIGEITAQKCGIIKEGCPVVAAPQIHEEVPKMIADDALERDCSFTLCDRDAAELVLSDFSGNVFRYREKEYAIRLIGTHQVCNAITAIEALDASKIPLTYEQVRVGLLNALIPARLERICDRPLVILDGAHNPDGAKALYRTLEPVPHKWVAIIGMMADKNYRRTLEIIAPLCKAIVAVTVDSNERSLSAEELALAAGKLVDRVDIAANYPTALELADRHSDGGPVFICGSFYLAGDIRQDAIEYFKNRT